jgi:hypothetical protein
VLPGDAALTRNQRLAVSGWRLVRRIPSPEGAAPVHRRSSASMRPATFARPCASPLQRIHAPRDIRTSLCITCARGIRTSMCSRAQLSGVGCSGRWAWTAQKKNALS